MSKQWNRNFNNYNKNSKLSVEEVPILSGFIFKHIYKQQRLFMPDSIRESLCWEGTKQGLRSSLLLTVGLILASDQVAQGFVQTRQSSLQWQRLCSLSGQYDPVLNCSYVSPHLSFSHNTLCFDLWLYPSDRIAFLMTCIIFWLPGRTFVQRAHSGIDLLVDLRKWLLPPFCVSAAFWAKLVHVLMWMNKHGGNERIKNATINHILPWHHQQSSVNVKMWPCIFSLKIKMIKITWFVTCNF